MNTFKQEISRLILSLLLAQSAAAASADISREEVAKHASRSDCWIIVDDGVYDTTSAMKDHDRHKYKLDSWCGKDATEGWNTKDRKDKPKPHSRKAKRMLQELRIGTLQSQPKD
jgi:cytochrome b involved in lipid metabolism